MRHFIRHPTDIPIHCSFQDNHYVIFNALLDVSAGGLSFVTNTYINHGIHLNIRIPVQEPAYAADCEVKWCRRVEPYYHVGVRFKDVDEAFGFRMVEQVCHIEHYRKEVLDSEGRSLSGEEAAMEWIQKYAQEFPR